MVSEHTASSWEFHTLFSLENRKVTNYRNGCGGKREYVLAATWDGSGYTRVHAFSAALAKWAVGLQQQLLGHRRVLITPPVSLKEWWEM